MNEPQAPFVAEPLPAASRLLYAWWSPAGVAPERLPLMVTDLGIADGKYQTVVACPKLWPSDVTIATPVYEKWRLKEEMNWLARAGFDIARGVAVVRDGEEQRLWPPPFPGPAAVSPAVVAAIGKLALCGADTLVLSLATEVTVDAERSALLDGLQRLVPLGCGVLVLQPGEAIEVIARNDRLATLERQAAGLRDALIQLGSPDQARDISARWAEAGLTPAETAHA